MRSAIREDARQNEWRLTEIADRFGLSKSVLVRKAMTEGLEQYAEHKRIECRAVWRGTQQVLDAQQVLGDLDANTMCRN